MIKRKRSQQEIMGFVIIIVIVAIIGVIFLGISLRKATRSGMTTEDAEIANFLTTSSKYTTDCVLKNPFYAELDEVISGCYNGKMCIDSIEACNVLSSVYSEMLAIAWPTGENRPIKYSKLLVYYQSNPEDPNSKIFLIDAIETGQKDETCISRAGRISQYKYPGNLVTELEICSG